MATGIQSRHPAGWYPDPLGRAEQRYWSGSAWTGWVFAAGQVGADSAPPRPLGSDDVASLDFVRTVFLPSVRSEVAVSPEQYAAMWGLAQSMLDEAMRPKPAAAAPGRARPAGGPGTAEVPSGLRPVMAVPASVVVMGGPPVPATSVPDAAPPPRRVPGWWSRSLAAIGSDLAVHGLAYLGVLLLFVGSFGLVAFAFGDVAPSLRPVAEIALALAPFAAARLLLARGAVVAGRAVELAGGLLLPIMAITSFLDGVGLPPDLSGPALAVALTATAGGVSGGYAAWSARHPDSALRFLVAPTAWLAVALATSGIGRAIPSGSAVASLTAAQVAAVTGAMALSAAGVRRRPDARLADATLTATLVGAPIVGLLAVLSWMAESFPPIPIAVTGLFGLALLELLAARLGPDRLTTVQTAWWAVVWIGLTRPPDVAPVQVSMLILVGFVVLLEAAAARRPMPWLLALPAAGVLGSLAVAWSDPWWAVAATAAVAVWTLARRATRDPLVALAPEVFDLAAGALPAAAVMALWRATGDGVTALAAGAVLVLAATVPATRPVLRRTADDRFWPVAWGVWLGLVALAAALAWAEAYPAAQAGRWLLAGAVAALTLAAGLGPIRPAARVWLTIGLGCWAWLLVGQAAGLSPDLRAIVVSVAALTAVIAGHTAARVGAVVAGNLALAGHVLGALALTLPGSDWGLTAMVALATAGWLVTSWYDQDDRSAVGSLLAGLGAPARLAPPVLAAVGIPTTAGLGLNAGGVLVWSSTWWLIVPAATAVVYAAGSRLPLNARTITALVWTAIGASLLAPVAASEPWPAATALGCLVACVILITPSRRPTFMVWLAWAALAPLAALVAAGTSDQVGDLPGEQVAAVSLVTVGGALVLLAAAGVRGGGWQPRRGRPDPSVLPPLLIGAGEVGAGVGLAWAAVPNPLAGWLTAAAAAIALVLGLLRHVGVLVGVSAGLGWLAVLMLAQPWIEAHPWTGVAVAAALLPGCEAAHRVIADRRWWARWDVGLFVVANGTILTSLMLTASYEVLDALGAADVANAREVAVTRAGAGLLLVGIAIRLRRRTALAVTYAGAGLFLLANASSNSGPGWYALMLAALSIGLTVLARRAHGRARVVGQVAGALSALGAWVAVGDWLDWTDAAMFNRTALLASMVSLGVVVALRAGRLGPSWVVSWGSVAGLTAATVTTVALPSTGDVGPNPATVAALLILAGALAAAATPLALPWLRDLAAVSLLAAEIHGLVIWAAVPAAQVGVLSATALLCAAALLLTRGEPVRTWRRTGVMLGVIADLAAAGIALAQLPDSTLLVPALLAGAGLAAAIGVVFASLATMTMAPVLACAAWLVFANEALSGNPQWYTVPIGVALLVVVGLARQGRRERGLDPAARQIVLVELAAVGILVGPGLVQAITESLGYAVLTMALGLGISAWGVITQVRRRVMSGALAVLAAVVELVAVPLVQLLPAWGGAGTWVLIIVVGLVALSAATLLEWARSTVRRAVAGFAELTQGWE